MKKTRNEIVLSPLVLMHGARLPRQFGDYLYQPRAAYVSPLRPNMVFVGPSNPPRPPPPAAEPIFFSEDLQLNRWPIENVKAKVQHPQYAIFVVSFH